MTKDQIQNFVSIYSNSLTPPYNLGFRKWAEQYIPLPTAYAIPGKLDLSISPYLHKPMEDVDNPRIKQINLCMATQVGKSLISSLAVLYWIVNNPGPIYRIFQNNDISAIFTETRLIPLLRGCELIKPLLSHNRFSAKKKGIILPHMAVTLGGANDGLAHGMSVKYLLADELHEWELGMFNKFVARTTAFEGRKKIICTSQPNEKGSEWEEITEKGMIYEWHWKCHNEKCNRYQPYHWSKSRGDNTYAGFNWDSVINEDGEITNIAQSAKTTWLECEYCRERHYDNPLTRRRLNDEGTYVCVKNDGASDIVTYTCPIFVNINLSFETAATQYMLAKKAKRQTGLDEQMKIFVNQVLGKFYKAEHRLEISKILMEMYNPTDLTDKDYIKTMGVDVQRNGNVKYWVIWAYHRNGNESKRVDFGIARTWEEVEKIRKKHNVLLPMVGVDSGDGSRTLEVYQECIKHGTVIKAKSGQLQYVSWTPMKGSDKGSFKHKDNHMRLYSEVSNQDTQFPVGNKFRGIPAPLILWATTPIKIILTNLRDNKLKGIKWMVDRPDNDFDLHMYSEDLKEVVDKKTGLTTTRWIQNRDENHYLDATAMGLALALMANVFSPTKIDIFKEQLDKIDTKSESEK